MRKSVWKHFVRYTIFLPLKILCGILLTAIVLASIPYALCPIYDMPATVPHSGAVLLNPYSAINDTSSKATWRKANFHAHSVAWSGLSHGNSSLAALSASYKRLGYDVAAVSNYHRMDTLPDFATNYISSYEHGYNVRKAHQICVGAQDVVWTDYVFGHWMPQKQHNIKRLKEVTPVVILAHPIWQGAYSPESMRFLTDYDGMEVFNHFRESLELFDSAWSAGRTPWAMGADDSHDVNGVGENGVCWTMLYATSSQKDSVLSALQEGRCYAVKLNSLLRDRWRGLGEGHLRDSCLNALNDCRLQRLTIQGDSLTVMMDSNVVMMRFVGQSGAVRSVVTGQNTAGYRFRADDTYIRIEVISPNTTIALNPVFRTANGSLPRASATVSLFKTTLSMVLWLIVYGSMAWVVYRRVLFRGRLGRTSR
ncbi:MAG: hypothetical protein JNN25_10490 [Candidatus Kapabacteria bacterium]|nr:hypothetical protein [Candidatus Kapabacteria bacterium]